MLSRVSQLDTTLLDKELFNILIKDPTPETSLLIRAALLHLGLQTYNASYGARLQNLVYANLTQRKRWLLVLLATVPSYIHQKMRDAMLVNGWPDYPTPPSILPWRLASSSTGPASTIAAFFPAFSHSKARRKRELRRFAWDTLVRIEKLLALSSLVNFLCFLYNGKHPTLISRLLQLRYSYAQKSVARNVSYDFLNRQLVWEAFTEFLLFVMPIINLPAIKKRLGQLVDRKKWFRQQTESLNEKALQNGDTADGKPAGGPLKHLSPDICAICYLKSPATGSELDPVDPTTSTAFLASMSHKDDHVTVPYVTSCCGARYCYYCIASAIVEDFTCLRCGKKVMEVRRESTSSP